MLLFGIDSRFVLIPVKILILYNFIELQYPKIAKSNVLDKERNQIEFLTTINVLKLLKIELSLETLILLIELKLYFTIIKYD